MTDQYRQIDEENEYKVYPQRHMVTGLFVLVQMMASVLMNTLNPIAASLSHIYDYSPLAINLGGLLYILMHPIFTFPAAYVIDSKGVKAGIIVGSVLGLISVGLRLLVNEVGFWIVLVAQVLGGIGRPFIMNCQAKISANWYRADTRGGITQLLTLVVNVSLIIGILIPGVLFKGYKYTPENVEEGKKITFDLMLIEAIMGLVCFLPNIFFQIQKPPTPPSESGDIERQPFKQALGKLFKNRNYILLLMAFGLYFGLFNAISVTLSFILKPWFGNNSLVVTLVGGSPVISGIIGVMILGPIQRRQKKYKKWILICMLGSTSAMLIFYPLLQTYSVAAAALVSAYNSFFLIPLVPIMLELGCQLVFPVGEGAAVGLLFAFGNLFGFLLGLIMSVIVTGNSKVATLQGLGLTLGLFIAGLILIGFMKEEKNREIEERKAYERRKSAQSSLNNSLISDDGVIHTQPINYNDSTNDPANTENILAKLQ